MRHAGLCLIVLAAAVPSSADVAADLAKCRAVTDSLARLSCYDALTPAEGATKSTETEPADELAEAVKNAPPVAAAVVERAKAYASGKGELQDVRGEEGCVLVSLTAPAPRIVQRIRKAKKELREATETEIQNASMNLISLYYSHAAPYFSSSKYSSGWRCKGSEAPKRIFLTSGALTIEPIAPLRGYERETTYGSGATATSHTAIVYFDPAALAKVTSDLKVAVVYDGGNTIVTIKAKDLVGLNPVWARLQ